MSDYEIVAMGDAQLLAQMIEGVALFAGGNDFQTMIKSGLIIGMLIAAAKAIFSDRLRLTSMIVGFFVYAVMFMPKVSVNIIDPYGDSPTLACSEFGVSDSENARCAPNPGGVITIDNVPIGLAAPSYIASQIGIGLTEKFAQVFGSPDMFQKSDGFLNAVRILAKLRGYDGGSKEVGGNPESLGRLKQTLVYYWRDCVVPEINAGQKNMATIGKSTDLASAIASTNINRDTLDLTELSGNQQKSCKAVSDILTNKFADSAYLDAMKDGLAQKGISSAQALDDALVALIKDASVNSSNIMKNIVMATTIKCAKTEIPSHDCIAITQATAQQQSQWAAEQSIFKQTMRPMMAFIEMFSVGASPIMAFLIASGLGIQLATKYFQLMAWISLWPVSMTLCNIYIYSNSSRSLLSSLPDTTNPQTVMSMTGMESMFTTTADWVAVGGMMAAATPVLTFFLVNGSSNAFQSLAGRLGGAGHLNPKMMAPDLHTPASFSQGQAGHNIMGRNSFDNLANNSSGGTIPNISGQSISQSMAASTLQTSQQATRSLAETHGNTVGVGTNAGFNMTAAAAQGKKLTNSTSRFAQVAAKSAESVGRNNGLNQSQTDALAFAADAALGLGAAGIPIIKAAIGAISSQKFGNNTEASKSFAKKLESSLMDEKGFKKSNNEEKSIADTQEWAKTAQKTASENNQSNYNKGLSLLDTASKVQSAQTSFTQSNGSGFNQSAVGFVESLGKMRGGVGKANKEIKDALEGAGITPQQAVAHANRMQYTGESKEGAGYLAAAMASGDAKVQMALASLIGGAQAGAGNPVNTGRVMGAKTIENKVDNQLDGTGHALGNAEINANKAKQEAGEALSQTTAAGETIADAQNMGLFNEHVNQRLQLSNGQPFLTDKEKSSFKQQHEQNAAALEAAYHKDPTADRSEFEANAQQFLATALTNAFKGGAKTPGAVDDAVVSAIMNSDMTPEQKGLAGAAWETSKVAAGTAASWATGKKVYQAGKAGLDAIERTADALKKTPEFIKSFFSSKPPPGLGGSVGGFPTIK